MTAPIAAPGGRVAASAGCAVVTVTLPTIKALDFDDVPDGELVLRAYWVGMAHLYAAYARSHALVLALRDLGTDGFDYREVIPLAAQTLDIAWSSRRGRPIGTLRGILEAMPGPGCLAAPGYLAGVDLA